jgi:predicted ATPase
LTFRPDFNPPWAGRSHLTQVTLPRLPRRQAAEMAGRVARGKALPPEVIEQVVAKTDGVPLFVEELTKTVLESGLLREHDQRYDLTGPLPPLAIPATLHDSLMARLDRLATVKSLAQLGASLGREFSYDLLQAVALWDEGTLQRGLQQLVAAEFLYQRGAPPQATYRFKHALIQDAAYQSLLKSTRQRYHQRIAQVIEERFPETAKTQPELLAHHYTEAGLNAQAIPYWQRAGQRASERSAHMEAISHLSKGLEVLKTLPDTLERAQQELVLQTLLGPVLNATKGQAAPEVEQAYARALELCEQVEESPQLFPVLMGLWRFYTGRAQWQVGQELAARIFSVAQRLQDPELLLEAHFAQGGILLHRGEVDPACLHLEQGFALYDPQQHRSHAFIYGYDPGVVCLSRGSWALWLRGYPDQARQKHQGALSLARELRHPPSLALALCFAVMFHQFRREGSEAQAQAEAAISLATEQGFAHWVAWARGPWGWALTEQGQGEEGVVQIQQGLAFCQAIGAEINRPYLLAPLAEAYGKNGQAAAGLATLAEALRAVHSGERFWEAEIHRLQGELLLARSAEHHAEAETCFRQALDIAHRQQEKSLELRAATSLSRLWQQQGKRGEARELLAPVYDWFTEGFDTADLQEAEALLEELA